MPLKRWKGRFLLAQDKREIKISHLVKAGWYPLDRQFKIWDVEFQNAF